ncbi:helix-turn-helix domain-containing protein [Bacillus sp. FJAT-28004]|uniref:helix-turn-helix domain-containing protein n=1 Tax=Bacillus sp. FJAT-28004 TaxID=1679165 RepID=UPI0006B4BFD3|nr:helix-turn-helix transcriptional regulator [Bacillus sp. FJAT-28004]
MLVFGKRLKAERELKKNSDPKWTQEFVANLIGVARPTFTAYENGTKEPPIDTINKIADTFNVSIDYLQGRTDIKSPRVNQESESEVFIAYLGGPPEEIDEEEAEHLKEQLAMFRSFKEKRKKEQEQEKNNKK